MKKNHFGKKVPLFCKHKNKSPNEKKKIPSKTIQSPLTEKQPFDRKTRFEKKKNIEKQNSSGKKKLL